MIGRVTSARLIGRSEELAALDGALAEARTGRPRVVLLSGESGLGKSRLVAELVACARDDGLYVLTGDCLELADAELPYVPIVAALRPLAREKTAAVDDLPAAHRAALAALLPGLAATDGRPATVDEAGQGRLFEALLALLERLSRDCAVLLALEDLHWADRSTRAFIAFLARNLSTERVLVVGTFRSDELHRRHPLRPLVTDLERDPRVMRVDLQPLDRLQVGEAIEDILGRRPQAMLVERIFARAEGNPLFVEELVAAGGDGGAALPESLREALMVRVDRLSEDAQAVLRVVSVGDQLDHRTLAEASGLEPVRLAAALREAVASQLLVADADGRHRFRHALLREVVADDLLPGERHELHRALARALQAKEAAGEGGPQVAAGIAHHFHQAGDRAAALETSVRAAQAAECVYAYGEAAALLERALDLWEQVPDAAEIAGCDHVALLRRAADAQSGSGDRMRAESLLRAALGELDREAEPARAAELLRLLARAQRTQNRTREALETAREALALVPAADSPERADILAFLAKTRMLQGKFRDAGRVAEEALTVARASGNRHAEITALDAWGPALIGRGELERGRELLREAIELARSEDEQDAMGIAYLNLADALHLHGRTDEALAIAREGIAHAVPTINKSWLETLVAEIALDQGDWDEVEPHLPPYERRLSGNEMLNVGIRRADLALGRGDHDEAERQLARLAPAMPESSQPQYLGPYGALLAELRRRQGDLDAAAAAIDEALDRIEFCSDDVMRVARVSAIGVAVEADRAERAQDLRDEAEAAKAAGRIEVLLPRVEAAAEDGGPIEEAWCLTARAHAARGRHESVAEQFASAAAAWEEFGFPYRAAFMRLYEAEARVREGGRGEAEAPIRGALAAARRLGAGWLVGELEALAARARVALDGPGDGEPDAPAPAVDPFGLTPRERQVLILLARGATNREIGEQLFMAEKTASVHVSRILAKLDVRRRGEAAAVAHRLGLLQDPE